MKKCGFCGKEITYHEQYCCDDCQLNANKYYEKSEKFAKAFYVISMICLIGIPVGLFLLSIFKLPGAIIASSSCLLLGILILLVPMPTEGMIKKHKIQKAVFRTRIFGLCVIALGALIMGLMVIFS